MIQSGGTTAVNEQGATSDTFTVALTRQPTSSVVVNFSTNGQCTLSPTSRTFTTANWSTAQSVTVTAVNDSVDEAASHNCAITSTVTTTDSAYSSATSPSISVDVADNDTAGITVGTPVNATEGGSNGSFTMVLTSQPTANVTIGVSSDAQCTLSASSITFTAANWSTAQTVTVAAVNDSIDEASPHPCAVTTAPATSADSNYSGIDPANVSPGIVDNDTAGITVGTPVNAREGGTNGRFTLVLTSQPTADVTIGVSSDAQCTLSPTSITFTAANWNTAQTLTVLAVNDSIDEASTHPCAVTTAAATSTDPNYNGRDPANLNVGIVDNDTAGFTVGTPVSAREGGANGRFTLVLTSQPTADVTIGVSSDAQCTLTPTSITFTAANWNVAQTVTVLAVNDSIDAASTHPCAVTTAPATSTDSNYNGRDPANVNVGIVDNDTAGFTIGTPVNATEDGSNGSFTMVLTSQPTADVTIGLSSNAQCTLSPTSITFTAANWNVAQTVAVAAVNDSIDEASTHPCAVTTAPATSTDPNYSNRDPANVSPGIVDNDTAGIMVGTPVNATEDGSNGSFTMVLTSQPTADVTVGVSANAQCTLSPTSITFTAANWNVAQTVTVTAVNDSIDEASPHPCAVTTAAATSTDPNYNGRNPANVNVGIVDNDTAGIAVGTPENATEGGSNGSFTMVLNSQPTANVTIGVSSNAQCTLSPTSITFTAANWNVAQTVTVAAVNDNIIEASPHPCAVTTAAATSTDANYSGRDPANVSPGIVDNDTAGVTIGTPVNATEGGSNGSFTMVLTSQPTANVTIGVSPDSQCTLSPTSITFTAANWNVAQTVTVAAVNDSIDEASPHPCSVTTAAATSSDPNYSGINPADVSPEIVDNDTAGITVTPAAVNIGESGATANVSVVLTAQPTGNVSVSLAPDSQCSLSPSGPLTFTTANWNTAQVVTVTAVEDFIAEGSHSCAIVTAATSTDSNYNTATGGVNPADIAATITDNDTAGITISPTTANVAEGAGTNFTVSLLSKPTSSVVINLSTSSQCSLSATQLTFTSILPVGGTWFTPQQVTVTAVQDLVAEGTHQCVVTTTVASASTADPNYTSINPADVTVTITDDDTAELTVGDLVVSEADGTATFTVELSQATGGPFTLPFSFADVTTVAADFGTIPGAALSFAGTAGETQTVVIPLTGDSLDENNETASLTLGTPSNTFGGGLTAQAAAATLTIEDDDTAGVTVSESGGGTEVTEGGAADSYTVILTSQPTHDVTITLSGGTQCALGSSTLTFTPLNWDTAQTVTVTAVDDAVAEGTHSCTITQSATSTDTNYNGMAIASVTGTITDNDAAGLVVSRPSLTVSESGTTESFTVRLNSEPTALITVTVASSDTGEGAVSPITLTFTAADWAEPQMVTLTGMNDVIIDGDITYSLTLNPDGDAAYDSLSDSAVAATTTDDDVAGVTLSESGGGTDVTEGGATDTLDFVLDAEPAGNVTVTLTVDGQCTVSPNPLSFDATNWNTVQTVTVTAFNDDIVEGAHSCLINTAVTSGDSNFNGIAVGDVTGDVTDNDTAGVTVSEGPGGVAVAEEGQTSDSFTVVLTSEPSGDVTYDFASGSQCTLTPASITFTAANWNVAQAVTVKAVDDALVETNPHDCDITSTVTTPDINYENASTPSVMAEVADNDAAGVSVDDGDGVAVDEEGETSDSFPVVLTSEPSGDVTYYFSSGSQCTLAPASITFTAANWNVAQLVTVKAVDDAVVETNPHDCDITSTVSTSDINYESAGTPAVTAAVADNDAAGVTVEMIAGAFEGGANGTMTVVLLLQPVGAVTVSLTPDSQCVLDGAAPDGTLSLTFTSADWSTPKTVTVIAIDDLDVEPSPHDCFVTRTVSAPLDPGYENEGGIGQSSSDHVDVIDNDSTCPAQQAALPAAPALRSAGPEASPMAAASTMSLETLDMAPLDTPPGAECTDVPDEIVRPDMEALSYNFMAQRLNLISSHGPQLAWLGNRVNGFGGTNGFQVTGENGNLTGNFAFSSGGISNALNGPRVMPTADTPRGGINAWVEGQFAFYDDKRENEDVTGDFFIGYAGIDVEVFENVNLGIMGEVDWMDERGDDDDRVEGTGWMIGPYLSAQISEGVFLDVRAMYGQTSNSIRQINRWDRDDPEEDREVEHAGDFDTERLLAEATLSGNYAFNNTVLTPDVRFLYIREEQSDFFVECVCGPTDVDGQTVELAQLSGGLRISQLIALNGVGLRPYASGRLFWNFDDPGEMVVLNDNTLDATVQKYATDDLRAMISLGLDGSTDNLQFGFEASYDGLFADDDHAYGGRVSLGYRF